MSSAGPVTQTIEARTHGRFLLGLPSGPPPWPMIVGFHGYAETAEDHLEALRAIAGTEAWLLVAVQGLHRFYARREQRVVASWMTRQDRELAIADNLDYVGRVLTRVRDDYRTAPTLVFSGFSQGVAMAYRAASQYPARGVIALAGDVPPDVAGGAGPVLPPILIGRGTADEWYTGDKEAADRAALARRSERVDVCVFEGGHEWTDPFRRAAADFLHTLHR